jgi:inner membrane transporter RhtA
VMNSCFYVAIDRLPLGTVAAIEFLPVILLAAIGVRSLRNGFALALAVAGVYILTDVRLAGEPLGVVFAFANAALFALYIVLAHRVARSSTMGRIDGLAAAMLIASLAITPIGGWSVAPALFDPVALGAGIGVGITSSVIPYVCDQLAMSHLSRATYSLMVSLLPATATVVGILVLAQIPTTPEVLGVVLVVLAVAAHRERSDPTASRILDEAERHQRLPVPPREAPALGVQRSVVVLEGEVGTANGSGQLRRLARELEPRCELLGDFDSFVELEPDRPLVGIIDGV